MFSLNKKTLYIALVVVVGGGSGLFLFGGGDGGQGDVEIPEAQISYDGGGNVSVSYNGNSTDSQQAVGAIGDLLKDIANLEEQKKVKKDEEPDITKEAKNTDQQNIRPITVNYSQNLNISSPRYVRERRSERRAQEIVAQFSSTNVEKVVEGLTIGGITGGVGGNYISRADLANNPEEARRLAQKACAAILQEVFKDKKSILAQNDAWQYTYVLERLQYISGFGAVSYAIQDSLVVEIIRGLRGDSALDISRVCDKIASYSALPKYGKSDIYAQCMQSLDALVVSKSYTYNTISNSLGKIPGFKILGLDERDSLVNAILGDLKGGTFSPEKYCSKITALIDKSLSGSELMDQCLQVIENLVADGIHTEVFIKKSLNDGVRGFMLIDPDKQDEIVQNIIDDFKNEGKFFAEKHCSAIVSLLSDIIADLEMFNKCVGIVEKVIEERLGVTSEIEERLQDIPGYSILKAKTKSDAITKVSEAITRNDASMAQPICLSLTAAIINALQKSAVFAQCLKVLNSIISEGRVKDKKYVGARLPEIVGYSNLNEKDKESIIFKVTAIDADDRVDQQINRVCMEIASTIAINSNLNAMLEVCLKKAESIRNQHGISIIRSNEPSAAARKYIKDEFEFFGAFPIDRQTFVANSFLEYLEDVNTKEGFCEVMSDVMAALAKDNPLFQCIAVLTTMFQLDEVREESSPSSYVYKYLNANLKHFPALRADFQASMVQDIIKAEKGKDYLQINKICTIFADIVGEFINPNDIPEDDLGLKTLRRQLTDNETSNALLTSGAEDMSSTQKRLALSQKNDFAPIPLDGGKAYTDCQNLVLKIKVKYDLWADQGTRLSNAQLLALKEDYISDTNESIEVGEYYIPKNKVSLVKERILRKLEKTIPQSTLLREDVNATIVDRVFNSQTFLIERAVSSSNLSSFLLNLAKCTHDDVDVFEWDAMYLKFQNFITGTRVSRVKTQEDPAERLAKIESHYVNAQCATIYSDFTADTTIDDITHSLEKDVDYFRDFTPALKQLYSDKAKCYISACVIKELDLGRCVDNEDLDCAQYRSESCNKLVSALFDETPINEDQYSSPDDFMKCELVANKEPEDDDFLALSPQLQSSMMTSVWSAFTKYADFAKNRRRDIVSMIWNGLEQSYGQMISPEQCSAIMSEVWSDMDEDDISDDEFSTLRGDLDTLTVRMQQGKSYFDMLLQPPTQRCKCYFDKIYDLLQDQKIQSYAICGGPGSGSYTKYMTKFINQYGGVMDVDDRRSACDLIMKQVISIISDNYEIERFNLGHFIGEDDIGVDPESFVNHAALNSYSDLCISTVNGFAAEIAASCPIVAIASKQVVPAYCKSKARGFAKISMDKKVLIDAVRGISTDVAKRQICIQKLRDIYGLIHQLKLYYWLDGEGWNRNSNCNALSDELQKVDPEDPELQGKFKDI